MEPPNASELWRTRPFYAVSAITVPFLTRNLLQWRFSWPAFEEQAVKWRRDLSRNHNILFRKELHAYQILKCQGLFHKKGRNLSPVEAVDLYKDALATLTFLPQASILTTIASDKSEFAGQKGMSACMLALFQRMRTQCSVNRANGMVFFDEGHPEYIAEFRRSQKYLPTGSSKGGWGGKATKNMPLDMFPKDANFKSSSLSYFVQIADLIVYAARVKIEAERGLLAQKRVSRGHHQLYDALPKDRINLAATRRRADGIVQI